jgi:hypothetical protein
MKNGRERMTHCVKKTSCLSSTRENKKQTRKDKKKKENRHWKSAPFPLPLASFFLYSPARVCAVYMYTRDNIYKTHYYCCVGWNSPLHILSLIILYIKYKNIKETWGVFRFGRLTTLTTSLSLSLRSPPQQRTNFQDILFVKAFYLLFFLVLCVCLRV